MNNRYVLTMKKDVSGVKGILHVQQLKEELFVHYEAMQDIPFCPAIILGDVIDMKKKAKPLDDTYIRNMKLNDGRFVITNQNILELAFGEPIEIEDSVSYLDSADCIKILINNEISGETRLTLANLEEREPFLLHNLKICHIEEMDAEKAEFYKSIKKKSTHTLVKIEKKDFKRLGNHVFYYNCDTMDEVIFSILHYLIINKYKFANCIECGRNYASNANNNKYCTRTAKYRESREPLSCANAHKDINYVISRKRKQIMKMFYARNIADFSPFTRECDKYQNIIDDCPSLENKLKYNAFLSELLADKRKGAKEFFN